ncbi:phospho-2-dehydro-3-deoxyheptonate aldolase, partial [Streptomyces sp. TM32]
SSAQPIPAASHCDPRLNPAQAVEVARAWATARATRPPTRMAGSALH